MIVKLSASIGKIMSRLRALVREMADVDTRFNGPYVNASGFARDLRNNNLQIRDLLEDAGVVTGKFTWEYPIPSSLLTSDERSLVFPGNLLVNGIYKAMKIDDRIGVFITFKDELGNVGNSDALRYEDAGNFTEDAIKTAVISYYARRMDEIRVQRIFPQGKISRPPRAPTKSRKRAAPAEDDF